MLYAEGMNTIVTVRDFIHWGASRLEEAGLVFGHGTDNALDESAALIMHVVHSGTGLSEDHLDAVLGESARQDITRLIELRISTRKPAAYLTHEAWFAGLPFYVDGRVLVPRSPIAELIECRFSPWVVPEQVSRLLDLCTGSACIGIACACAFPEARIDATDISIDALAVARKNIERHDMEQRIRLVETSVFEHLGELRYDIIVSNPPYVSYTELRQLPDEFQHEPALGLAAGDDGLDIVVRILKAAAGHLADKGILVVEVGYSQQALMELFPKIPFLWLEFEYGGEGVFLLERDQLVSHQQELDRVAVQRELVLNEVRHG